VAERLGVQARDPIASRQLMIWRGRSRWHCATELMHSTSQVSRS
jgi:hypothetical protein